MRKISFLFLLLITVLTNKTFSETVNIIGHVTYAKENISDVSIQITKHESYNFTDKGTKISSIITKNGVFKTKLDVNNYYLLELSKVGLITQKVGLSTNAPATAVSAGLTKKCEIDVNMFKSVADLDIKLFEKPIAKYKYSREEEGFEADLNYEDDLKPNLTAFTKKLNTILEKEYQKSYTEAKKKYDAKKYEEALLLCNQALDFLPNKKEARSILNNIQKELSKNTIASKNNNQLPKPFLTTKGFVTKNNKGLADVTINIIVDGKIIAEEKTKSDGTFSFVLDKNIKYTIEFAKQGMVSKKYLLNTTLPTEDARYTYEFDFTNIDLFEMIKGLDITALDKPYGKIGFVKDRFDANDTYKEKMINEELKILAQLEKIKKEGPKEDQIASTQKPEEKKPEVAETKISEPQKTDKADIKNEENNKPEENTTSPIAEKINHNTDNETNNENLNEQTQVPEINHFNRIDSLQNLLSNNNLNNPKEILSSLNSLASSYYITDDLDNALEIYNKVLNLSDSLKDNTTKSEALRNIGILYDNMFNIDKAIEFYKKSLNYYIEAGDNDKISEMNYRIGNAYYQNNDFGKAITFFAESLEKDKATNKENNVAATYNNLGVMYYEMQDYDGAISYYEKSIEILEKGDNKKELSMSYNNMGNVNYDWDKFDEALKYYQKSLSIKEDLNYQKGIAISIHNIGNVYKSQKKYDEALSSYNKSLEISEKSSFYDIKYKNYSALSELYAIRGNCNKSLEYYKLFAPALALGKNFSKQLSEIQNKYEGDYIKKDAEISVLKSELKRERILAKYEANQNEIKLAKKNAEIEKNANKVKVQRIMIIASIIGLLGVLIFLILLYKENKQKRRANTKLQIQRDAISKQKDEILVQKIELTDSILYAKRIQTAILPPEEYLSKDLPEHFVLFKPKNIVSGDFYWMAQRDNKMFFAASDCTGHGVPGAFMSMLGIAFLNEIINLDHNLSAAEILNLLRAQVIKSLHQTGKENEAKDGMDIAFCILNLQTNELEFAGANNPLFVVRNNNNELSGIEKLEVVNPDKMPIGIYYTKTHEKFTNHKIQLYKNDSIYIFSDGYADQFGGHNDAIRNKGGKKFKSKQFKETILNMQNKPMKEQKEILNSSFENWKGNLEQIDDILVIGMRIK